MVHSASQESAQVVHLLHNVNKNTLARLVIPSRHLMVNAQAVVPTLSVYRAKNVISMLSALMPNVPIALNILLVKPAATLPLHAEHVTMGLLHVIQLQPVLLLHALQVRSAPMMFVHQYSLYLY